MRAQATDWRRKIEILQMERNRTRKLLKNLTGMAGTSVPGSQALSAANSQVLRAASSKASI